MPIRVSHEHADACVLDHLHTPATALAGVASKAAVGSAPPTSPGRARIGRRLAPTRRLLALFCVTGALLLAGGAALDADSPSAPSPAPNAVRALGGAPELGASTGLDLNAGVVDIAAHPSEDGYWLVSSDGGVFAYGASNFLGSAGGLQLNGLVVGMAATPSAQGYWLVGADGGVFSYGDAPFLGSLGGEPLVSPILSIAATPSGRGYWLVAADGGVFAFGDATFHGSATSADLATSVVGVAATPTGAGYWLLAADGGVFAFGDAAFVGANVDPEDANAFSIAAAPDGGYWVLRTSGVVESFDAAPLGDVGAGDDPAVGIAPRRAGGAWVALGEGPRALAAAPDAEPAPGPDVSQHPFLTCTRRIESGGNYGAVNPSGRYRGAYQFARATWDNTARHAGRLDLVGIDPAAAPPPDQDFLALHLYEWQGASPWLGRCSGR
ncbi:MAG: transglycosylase family protein [Actinomycetota bacterium]